MIEKENKKTLADRRTHLSNIQGVTFPLHSPREEVHHTSSICQQQKTHQSRLLPQIHIQAVSAALHKLNKACPLPKTNL